MLKVTYLERIAEIWISLYVRAVFLVFFVSISNLWTLLIFIANSEASDQTARMHRLTWIFTISASYKTSISLGRLKSIL